MIPLGEAAERPEAHPVYGPQGRTDEPLATINVPPWDGAPREAGEVWTLRKGGHVATCHVWTHPKGGEARLTIDGECHRGSPAVDGRTLLEVALEWREQFEGKGWR